MPVRRQALRIAVLTLIEILSFPPFNFPARDQRLVVDKSVFIVVYVDDEIACNKIIDPRPVAGIWVRAVHAERTRRKDKT
jgi:hypothetical protein